MDVKKRHIPLASGTNFNGTIWRPSRGVPTTKYENKWNFTGKQETVSEGHLYSPNYQGETRDVGGPFYTWKHDYRMIRCPEVYALQANSLDPDYFRGRIFPSQHGLGPTSTLWPNAFPDASQEMITKGTTAIARTIPTNPISGAAVFLGELKEGLPKVIGSQLLQKNAKSFKSKLGSEYLNVEFGWKPFISDLLSFGEAVRDADKHLRQLERDSGRNVRRRYRFPVEDTTEEFISTNAPIYGGVPTRCYQGNVIHYGTLTTTTRVKREFWFSGCYTYYIDKGNSKASEVHAFTQKANKLFGVRLTPDVLWNLAPWSWAADWVTNTGDVIHNLSAFSNDGLVLRYGYIMCKETRTVTRTHSGVTLSGYGPTGPIIDELEIVSKRRLRATPYGFGLETGAFTPRQLAIIAALGISRDGKVSK